MKEIELSTSDLHHLGLSEKQIKRFDKRKSSLRSSMLKDEEGFLWVRSFDSASPSGFSVQKLEKTLR